MIAGHHCILPHRIFLSIKPPDLHLVIPGSAHTVSHRLWIYALIAPAPSSNLPLRESTTCVLHVQHPPALASVAPTTYMAALGHIVAADFSPTLNMCYPVGVWLPAGDPVSGTRQSLSTSAILPGQGCDGGRSVHRVDKHSFRRGG